MTVLTADRENQITREVHAGVPHSEIAASYRISVAQVLKVERRVVNRRRRPVAEPLPELRTRDWKTARPAEERVRTGETCRFPECLSKVCRGSYCEAHGRLVYRPRVAA